VLKVRDRYGEAIVMPGAWPCGWEMVTETRICLPIALALARNPVFEEHLRPVRSRDTGREWFMQRHSSQGQRKCRFERYIKRPYYTLLHHKRLGACHANRSWVSGKCH
jgi:hypothetical protein